MKFMFNKIHVRFIIWYEMVERKLTKNLLLLFLTLVSGLSLQAQTRVQLEKKRSKLIEQIEHTNALIARTRKKKKLTVHDLSVIESQIKQRSELIHLLEEETQSLSLRTLSLQDSIALIEAQIEDTKMQYGRLLRRAYVNKMTRHPYQYFLSANSVAQGFQNMVYLRQIKHHIIHKYELLTADYQTLKRRKSSLQETIEKKQTIIQNRKKQQSKLLTDQRAKANALNKLEKREKELRHQLARKKKERINLNDAIEKIIIDELAKANASTSAAPTSSKDVALSNSFATNRGKLPWPVEHGTITSRFGRQKHKTLKQVFITNNGIDILANPGATVRSVYRGQVVAVANIPGYDKMVVVKQGDYYMVYSRLIKVNVKQGQDIPRGVSLGQLNHAGENAGLLHLEIWKGKTKLDPKPWLHP